MPKKKTAAKKTKVTKADFIRSQPAGMSAKDVIAKGTEAGLSLTEDTVYKTRSLDKKRKSKSGSAKAGSKKVAASASRTPRGKAPDKTNRVLELVAQNPEWSAPQIAKAAKCSVTHVYAVWRQKPKAKGGSTNGSARPKSPLTQHVDHVRALRGVILHVGIDRAKEMMDQIVKDLMVLPT